MSNPYNRCNRKEPMYIVIHTKFGPQIQSIACNQESDKLCELMGNHIFIFPTIYPGMTYALIYTLWFVDRLHHVPG